jgi:predicted kinase
MSIRTTVRDRVTAMTPEASASGAFVVINALQDIHPANQVLALATAFKITSEVLHLDPRELLSIVGRMEADCRYTNRDTLNAVHAYVDGEIRKRFS